MITTQKELNKFGEMLIFSGQEAKVLRNWVLLEDGTIRHSWFWIEWEKGEKPQKEYVMLDFEGEKISYGYDRFEKGLNGNYIQSYHIVPIFAATDTKKEAIELKRQYKLKRRRKMSKKQVEKFIHLLTKNKENKENEN